MMENATVIVLAVLWLVSLLAVAWLARRGLVSGALHQDVVTRLAAAMAQTEQWRGDTAHAQTQLAVEVNRAERLAIVEASLAAAQDAAAALRSELAAATALAEQERTHAEASLKLLRDTREQMTLEFHQLAHRVTAQHSETFKTQNKEQVEALLTPMRDRITEFQTWLATTHADNGKERAGLQEHIRLLLTHGKAMTDETARLTKALKGDVRQQGAWGEMILEALLENSGLTHGEHYTRQAPATGEEGQRLRPDIVLHLSSDQRVVIDSKVSLTAFEGFVNAEDDHSRTTHLGAHRTSLRSHIDGLARKSYADATGSRVGFTVMFVPIESALAAAMQSDPGLAAYAFEKGIGIATPVTLLMVLRTVHTVIQSEKRNTNAEAIAAQAGKLYNKFQGFAVDLLAVGAALDTAKRSHDSAVAKLSIGSGNLVGHVEKLKQLGAKTDKSLPATLLAAAGADEALVAE